MTIDCGCYVTREHATGCDGNHYPHDACNEPPPADAWCRRCDAPATELVDGEAYCREHALTERWKRAAPAWRGGPAM